VAQVATSNRSAGWKFVVTGESASTGASTSRPSEEMIALPPSNTTSGLIGQPDEQQLLERLIGDRNVVDDAGTQRCLDFGPADLDRGDRVVIESVPVHKDQPDARLLRQLDAVERNPCPLRGIRVPEDPG
jgi:hypothetical protein